MSERASNFEAIQALERHIVGLETKIRDLVEIINDLCKEDGLPPRGFFAGLTPEQQAAALAYRGNENHGRDTAAASGAQP